MGGAQCLAHATADRRERETDACTAYIRQDSDTMEGAFTQCSQMIQHYAIARGQSKHADHSSITFLVVHTLKEKS